MGEVLWSEELLSSTCVVDWKKNLAFEERV
jgi:hypothetical protein